jgi:hypothetical protein
MHRIKFRREFRVLILRMLKMVGDIVDAILRQRVGADIGVLGAGRQHFLPGELEEKFLHAARADRGLVEKGQARIVGRSLDRAAEA